MTAYGVVAVREIVPRVRRPRSGHDREGDDAVPIQLAVPLCRGRPVWLAHHQEAQVKYAPWAAALAVLLATLAAVLAIVLPGRPLPTARPGDLSGNLSRPLGRAAGVRSASPGDVAPGEAAGQTGYVVEQVSPIIGADSTLIEALGMESPPGRFKTVLPKGTRAPVGRIVIFGTGADNQREIRLHILRGGSESVSEDHSLGWVRIFDLPPGPKGATRIAVAFQVVDGAILLAAQNPADGRPLPIGPSEAPPGFHRS